MTKPFLPVIHREFYFLNELLKLCNVRTCKKHFVFWMREFNRKEKIIKSKLKKYE